MLTLGSSRSTGPKDGVGGCYLHLARWLDLDAESALRGASHRFERRFVEVEKRVSEQGRKLKDMTVDEMEEIWQGVKAQFSRAGIERHES